MARRGRGTTHQTDQNEQVDFMTVLYFNTLDLAEVCSTYSVWR